MRCLFTIPHHSHVGRFGWLRCRANQQREAGPQTMERMQNPSNPAGSPRRVHAKELYHMRVQAKELLLMRLQATELLLLGVQAMVLLLLNLQVTELLLMKMQAKVQAMKLLLVGVQANELLRPGSIPAGRVGSRCHRRRSHCAASVRLRRGCPS